MEVWAVEDSPRVRHPLEAGGDHVRVVPGDVIPAQVIRQHHDYEQEVLLEMKLNYSDLSLIFGGFAASTKTSSVIINMKSFIIYIN